MPQARAIDSIVATGKGDDGTTGLLYGGDRIAKDDLRTEAYGTIDEAVAALGIARAQLGLAAREGALPRALEPLSPLILRFQRELFVAAAELATNPAAWDRLVDDRTQVSAAMVAGVEEVLAEYEARIEMPREFVVPGETPASAALEQARTILRRAERRAVTLGRESGAIRVGPAQSCAARNTSHQPKPSSRGFRLRVTTESRMASGISGSSRGRRRPK